MHPDRVIVRMEIWSDGIPKRPDNQKTLTCQSSGTNDNHGDPILGRIASRTI